MTTLIKPAVGDGAYLQLGADAYAYTVIEVSPSGKTIKVQQDRHVRKDRNGLSEDQTYLYVPNPQAEVEVFTLRSNGSYHRKGQPSHYGALYVGERAAYRDPSF